MFLFRNLLIRIASSAFEDFQAGMLSCRSGSQHIFMGFMPK
jgi:hypothetical protein